MAQSGRILFRTAEASHGVALTTRDVHLLDGRNFFRNGWSYRKLFALDFIRGLKAPPLVVPLVSHRRFSLVLQLKELKLELETRRDLILFDYTCSFSDDRNRSRSIGLSGFRVEGGYGTLSCRPAGYCDLTISEVGPNGSGRAVAMIDMRVRRQIETVDKGMLKIHSRKASVSWLDELEKLVEFLERQPDEMVEVLYIAEG